VAGGWAFAIFFLARVSHVRWPFHPRFSTHFKELGQALHARAARRLPLGGCWTVAQTIGESKMRSRSLRRYALTEAALPASPDNAPAAGMADGQAQFAAGFTGHARAPVGAPGLCQNGLGV